MGMRLYGTCVLVVRGVAYVFRHPERSRSASSPVGPPAKPRREPDFPVLRRHSGASSTQTTRRTPQVLIISPPLQGCQGHRGTSPPAPLRAGEGADARRSDGGVSNRHARGPRHLTTEIAAFAEDRLRRSEVGEFGGPLLNLCVLRVLCGEFSAPPFPLGEGRWVGASRLPLHHGGQRLQQRRRRV